MRDPVPDFSADAAELVNLIRVAPHDLAISLTKNQLGIAFSKGGLAAISMMRDGVEKLPAVPHA